MHRRDFLRSSALALTALVPARASAPALAAPALSAGTRDLVVTSPWPQSASGYSDIAFGFTRRLEQALGGRIRCHLQTQAASSIDALNAGHSDIHIGFEHGNVPHHAAFGYFAGLPGDMGLEAETFSEWLTNGGGQALWDDCSAQFGIKSLLIAHTATGGGLWSERELPALSGKKIAAQGIACDVLKGLGAEVADINSSGAYDAIEMSHVVEALERGADQTARFAIMPGLTRAGSTLAVSFQQEFWQTLDDELGSGSQTQVKNIAANTCRQATADLRANDRMLRKVLSETSGLSIDAPSPVLMTEITRVTEAVVADIAARDALSRRINSAYMVVRDASPRLRQPKNIV